MSDEATGTPTAEETADTRPPVPESNSDGYWKRQHEKAQRELDTLRKAQMSEAERIKVERDEARAEAQAAREQMHQILLQTRFEAEAMKSGCIDPEAAFSLADRGLLQMQDGKPVGIGKALKALAESRPYLFQQQQPQRRASGGNPPGGNGSGSSVNQAVNNVLRGIL
jgi:hypothetical protein